MIFCLIVVFLLKLIMKRIYNSLVFFFVFLLGISQAQGQDCHLQLSGTLIDLHDDNALEGGIITLLERNESCFSDQKGGFNFKQLCPGTYHLYIEHIGCIAKEVVIELQENKSDLILPLEHHIQELDEVTVASKSYIAISDAGVEKTIDTDIIQQNSSLQLADILSKISGVSSLNTGNSISKPIINGLHSSRVMIINNGVRMEDQEWGSEHAPTMDVNAISNITVVKGANALQYSGDAIGGIIVTAPEKITFKDTIYGSSILGSQSNSRAAFVTSSLVLSKRNGLQAKLQSSYQKQGDAHTPNYNLTNSATKHQNFSAYIAKKTTKKGIASYFSHVNSTIGILTASHIGDASDLYRALTATSPSVMEDFSYEINAPRQEVSHLLYKLNAYSIIKDKGKLLLQFDYQNNHRLEYDLRIGAKKNTAALDIELLTESLNLDYHSFRSNGLQLKTGLLGKYQFNYSNPETGVKRLIPDYVKLQAGVYGIIDYELENKAGIELGVRYDYIDLKAYKFYQKSLWEERGYEERFSEFVISENENQVLTYPQLSYPSLTATIGYHSHLGTHTNFAINVTHAKRAPNPAELFSEGLHHSASRIELGNLSFQQEASNKLSIAIEHHSDRTTVSVQPFYNSIENFIYLRPFDVTQTIRGFFQKWNYEQTNALLYGLDVDITQKLGSTLEYNSQFSWVHGTAVDEHQPLIAMPPLQVNNELSITDSKGNRFGIHSTSVAQQKRYPNYNFELYLPATDSYQLIDISSPPKAYHLIGLFANWSISKNSGISIRVTNLMNTSYRNYLNAMRYYADELGRNITVQYKITY